MWGRKKSVWYVRFLTAKIVFVKKANEENFARESFYEEIVMYSKSENIIAKL